MIDTTGRIRSVSRDWETNRPLVTLEVEYIPKVDDISGKDLDITIKPHSEKRSKNANALLWACLGKMASVLRCDKWEVYLKMLKRYGEFTYVCVKPKAVEMLKKQWRECEEIGVIDINGTPAVQMLCYYGSSTYNKRQFSVLLDGVFSEMEEMGIETPSQEELRRSLDAWGV